MEGEKRGGKKRSLECLDKEKRDRINIENHIDRYPKVESHYCRASTNRLYLHPDLSLRKMYTMFTEQEMAKACSNLPSFSTYRKIFKSKNLSFLHPKKDQCSLCLTYRDGDETIKENLKNRYEKNVLDKKIVREKKI
nr:unnamed protein product [Callosobruchus chinensis]CAH7760212.1 unnamed protein product [Callosobruchus chinensis]